MTRETGAAGPESLEAETHMATPASTTASREAAGCGLGNKPFRDEWLRRTLATIPAGQRILDAGAGELRHKTLCSHLDYVSQDFARYDGRGDGRGLHDGGWDCSRVDIACDITGIPEAEASFDAVMCVEVLEHVPAPIEAIRELVRVLRPGGALILTAPFCALTHQSPYFFHTGFSRYFYEHWLAQLGVRIDDVAFNGNYFEYLGQELHRLPTVGEEYAGATLTPDERRALATALKLLERLARDDRGSEQLLAYGLCVRGTKQ